MEIKAKIEQVSIDSYHIYKFTEYNPPSILIGNTRVSIESGGRYVKNCKSFEEARMLIDLNGWEYVVKIKPIEMSMSEYKKKYRKDGSIGYDDIDKILVDNGYAKYYS